MDALKEHFGLSATLSEGSVTFFVDRGEEFVPRLFGELDLSINSVRVARPTLDDVFMTSTGRTIRDAEATSADALRSPGMIITLLGEMILIALLLTAFGVLIASRMQRIESFQVVMQFVVLPMFFLSGAIFPLSRLPAWLGALTKFDPLTYAVDPMRRTVFEHLNVPPAIGRAFDPGVSWNGWHLPLRFELGLLAVAALGLLAGAVAQFARAE